MVEEIDLTGETGPSSPVTHVSASLLAGPTVATHISESLAPAASQASAAAAAWRRLAALERGHLSLAPLQATPGPAAVM